MIGTKLGTKRMPLLCVCVKLNPSYIHIVMPTLFVPTRNYELEEVMKSQGIYQPREVSHALGVTGEQGPTGILLDWVRGWDQDTRQLMLYQAARCSTGIVISPILIR